MDKPKKFPFAKGVNKLFPKIWKSSKKKYPFGNEVNDILSKIRSSIPEDAMIKEIFLKELVCNSVLALTKVRFESLVDKNKFGDPPELSIRIVPDKTNKTLSVIDTGFGMTRDVDLLCKIGAIKIGSFRRLVKYKKTIAKYSTLDAADVDLSRIYSEEESAGLGFYSAYMVADKVVITTKQKDHELYVWEFDANADGGYFTVAAGGCDSDILRWGTKVTLHLKEDQLEYLEGSKLQDLVNKYPKLMAPYPITISDENNKNPIEKQKEDEEEKEPLEQLKQRYERIQELFVEVIKEKQMNVTVVISDRVLEVTCNITYGDYDDKATLEINPRHPYMEELMKALEANNEEEKEEVKSEILIQFETCLSHAKRYDMKYGTSFYEKAKKILYRKAEGVLPAN